MRAWFRWGGRHMGPHLGFGMHRMGREWHEWNGPRARRGDVKFLILEVLAEGPRHGYDIMAALEERSAGRYRPSAGSIYPTLQLLEDGGFVTGEALEGKRVFTITDAGRELLKQKPAAESSPDGGDEHSGAFEAAKKLMAAVGPALHTSDPPTRAKLREILDRARREIYAVLAESE